MSIDPFIVLQRRHVSQAARDLCANPDLVADIDRILHPPDPPAVVNAAYPGPGESVLNDVLAFVSKYVCLPPHTLMPIGLWIIGTHIFDTFQTFPYLSIYSPAPGCGKTQLMKVAGSLCAEPRYASNISEAAIFRIIEKIQPTIFFDEMEQLGTKGDRAVFLNSILHAGHSADASAIRCEGKNFEVKEFRLFCPKCFAVIGGLPQALRSRSVPIAMQRRREGQKISRYLKRRVKPIADELRARIQVITTQTKGRVSAEYECMDLEFLEDREAENFEPLFAILRILAPDREHELENDAKFLTGQKHGNDESEVLSLRLLGDIRTALKTYEGTKIWSADLLSRLRGACVGLEDDAGRLEESPWASKEVDLDQCKMARMLRPYEIETRAVKIGGCTKRGYELDQFGVAFTSYLPADRD